MLHIRRFLGQIFSCTFYSFPSSSTVSPSRLVPVFLPKVDTLMWEAVWGKMNAGNIYQIHLYVSPNLWLLYNNNRDMVGPFIIQYEWPGSLISSRGWPTFRGSVLLLIYCVWRSFHLERKLWIMRLFMLCLGMWKESTESNIEFLTIKACRLLWNPGCVVDLLGLALIIIVCKGACLGAIVLCFSSAWFASSNTSMEIH